MYQNINIMYQRVFTLEMKSFVKYKLHIHICENLVSN